MKITAVEQHQHLFPVFEGDNPEAWLRAAFLSDTEICMADLLEVIQQVHQTGQEANWTGNVVCVDFQPGRVLITHQWMFDEQGNESEIEISLDEAGQLLRDWHTALEQYRRQKR